MPTKAIHKEHQIYPKMGQMSLAELAPEHTENDVVGILVPLAVIETTHSHTATVSHQKLGMNMPVLAQHSEFAPGDHGSEGSQAGMNILTGIPETPHNSSMMSELPGFVPCSLVWILHFGMIFWLIFPIASCKPRNKKS